MTAAASQSICCCPFQSVLKTALRNHLKVQFCFVMTLFKLFSHFQLHLEIKCSPVTDPTGLDRSRCLSFFPVFCSSTLRRSRCQDAAGVRAFVLWLQIPEILPFPSHLSLGRSGSSSCPSLRALVWGLLFHYSAGSRRTGTLSVLVTMVSQFGT